MGEPSPKIRSMPKTQDEIDLLSEDFEQDYVNTYSFVPIFFISIRTMLIRIVFPHFFSYVNIMIQNLDKYICDMKIRPDKMYSIARTRRDTRS